MKKHDRVPYDQRKAVQSRLTMGCEYLYPAVPDSEEKPLQPRKSGARLPFSVSLRSSTAVLLYALIWDGASYHLLPTTQEIVTNLSIKDPIETDWKIAILQ